MKVIRHARQYSLHLEAREKKLLFELLDLYPQIPPGHFQLSRSGSVPEPEANQHLLDEALAEQRAASRKQLHALLSEPKRCEQTSTGFRLRLTEGEVDWLLQVLNDIRIGSWIRLGSPEPSLDVGKLNAKNVPLYWAMELAGLIQMALLSALARPRT